MIEKYSWENAAKRNQPMPDGLSSAEQRAFQSLALLTARYKLGGLRAAYELGRASYGFEIDRDMCKKAKEQILGCMKPDEQEEQTTLFA